MRASRFGADLDNRIYVNPNKKVFVVAPLTGNDCDMFQGPKLVPIGGLGTKLISPPHRTKTFPTQKVGELIPNKVPHRHWQEISVEINQELLNSQGYNAVLVVVDCLSKRIHTIPTVTSLDSAGVARLFLEHVWHHHGLPEEVISDRRPAFMSNFSCKLAALLGVKLTPSTSYHPQTDGQMEHVNQEIEAYLRVFMTHRQDDSPNCLPLPHFPYKHKLH